MAVYTHLSDQHIQDFLSLNYNDDLVSATAINAGTENTNYHLKTQHKEFVLTLFESTPHSEVEAYVELTQCLARNNIATPTVIKNQQGVSVSSIVNKPSILTNFAAGKHPQCASEQQCFQIASELAKIHLNKFDGELKHYDLLTSIQDMFFQTKDMFSQADLKCIAEELTVYQENNDKLAALPSGALHTDLFKDNTLFQNDNLTAILDFYSAANGAYLFDLAILINDWCFSNDQQVIEDNISAVLTGYQTHRPLTDDENSLLPLALRMTACRFWLSRSVLTQQHGKALEGKSPDAFKSLLLSHLANA